MEISKLTDEQLKALCYDEIVVRDRAQYNINLIQNLLAQREQERKQAQEKPEEPK